MIDIVLNSPLYFVEGCIGVWQYFYGHYWPGFDRIVQSIILGTIGYWFMRLSGIKKLHRQSKKKQKKRKQQKMAAVAGAAENLLR